MITDALRALAAELTDAGILTDLDPAEVAVPGAWLAADAVDLVTLDGHHEIRADLHLVAPDLGTIEALEILEQMLATVAAIVPIAGPVDLDRSVLTPRGKLPAFTVPVRLFT